jgi:hypothetical protein
MMKKSVLLLVVSIFILSTVGAYAASSSDQPTAQPMETTKDRASRAMNNIFLGPSEIPDNMAQTNTKGTPMDRCTKKTSTGVERGIARLFAGVWQLATFWYSDPGPATPVPAAKSSSSTK